MYYYYNQLSSNKIDPAQKRGLNCTDGIFIAEEMIEVIEGSKLLEVNEIVVTDHRSYIIDINLKEYFQD